MGMIDNGLHKYIGGGMSNSAFNSMGINSQLKEMKATQKKLSSAQALETRRYNEYRAARAEYNMVVRGIESGRYPEWKGNYRKSKKKALDKATTKLNKAEKARIEAAKRLNRYESQYLKDQVSFF